MRRFRRTKGFSFFEQVVHELYVATRHRLNEPETRDETVNHLIDYKAAVQQRLFKFLTAFVIGAIAISTISDGQQLVVKFASLQLSLPEIYVVFATSLVWIVVVKSELEIRIVSCVISYIVNARFHTDRFSEVRTIFLGNRDLDLATPNRAKHLFRITPRNEFLISGTYILLFCLAALPVVFAFATIFHRALLLLFSVDGAYLQLPMSIASATLLPLTLVYFWLFVRVSPIQKNSHYIRWGFLSYIFPLEERNIEQLKQWVEDRDKDRS